MNDSKREATYRLARLLALSVCLAPDDFDYWITDRGEFLVFHNSKEMRNDIMGKFLLSSIREIELPLSRIDCLRYRVERRSALPHIPTSQSPDLALGDEVKLQTTWFDRHRRAWLDAVPPDLVREDRIDFQVRDGSGFLVRVSTA